MENFVFRKFMEKRVIHKTKIFADAFNLKINSWHPENSKEHPYRINFYSGSLRVGYIDAEIYTVGDSQYVENEMPYVLFTPFGKITGKLSYSVFDFKMDNIQDSFTEFRGLVEIKDSRNASDTKYSVGAYLTLKDLENNQIDVTFDRIIHSYDFKIVRTNRGISETLSLYVGDGHASIEHYDYCQSDGTRYLSQINLELGKGSREVPINFDFLDNVPYQKEVSLDCDSVPIGHYPQLEKIDFNEVNQEIEKNDPRMGEFIDEIRATFTLPANGVTPVSLYDRFAKLCFYYPQYKFNLALTRAKSTKVALDDSFILKKTR